MMPALFIGHGNPMNAVSQNAYTTAWSELGRSVPRPTAVLAISAHWYISRTAVTDNTHPRTIHDFGGFPPELFQMQYPAPGKPDLARRVEELLRPTPVAQDGTWGLDHGTWAVLCHVFPKADIPVVQLSIDATRPPEFHYDLGRRLAPLRNEGVLIVGSGNLVHNLREYAWDGGAVEPYDWAVRFEKNIKARIDAGDDAGVVDYRAFGRDAALAVPIPDHFFPLLYVLGTRQPGDRVSYPVTGVDGGSLSMLSMQLG
jgi:4,5-DOPA dioxygenase extradiol